MVKDGEDWQIELFKLFNRDVPFLKYVRKDKKSEPTAALLLRTGACTIVEIVESLVIYRTGILSIPNHYTLIIFLTLVLFKVYPIMWYTRTEWKISSQWRKSP